jgi:signal transduction histidine kinase
MPALRRAVANLVDNAVKYSEAAQVCLLRTRTGRGEVRTDASGATA